MIETSLTAKNTNSQAMIYSQDQMRLITSTVAKGATPDELKLFLYRAQNLGLDPLKPGQIHFVKYGNSPGTVVVGIDGFRAKASRTGKLSGIKRGAIKENGKLIGGWAEVYRTDWTEPAREEVPLSEYNTGKGSWAKMPETMIKKVAEVAALRMAFPDDLGGLFIHEEVESTEQRAREQSPKEDTDASEVIKLFYATYEKSCEKHGADFYKQFMKNSKGESPTIDQILNWKSAKQIAWLKDVTEQMNQTMTDELPDFDLYEGEVENA